jgi:hypothetical protein
MGILCLAATFDCTEPQTGPEPQTALHWPSQLQPWASFEPWASFDRVCEALTVPQALINLVWNGHFRAVANDTYLPTLLCCHQRNGRVQWHYVINFDAKKQRV